MSETTPPAVGGQVERRFREREAWCPVCLCNRPSLPAPAEGPCAYCMNHLMRPCSDCANYRETSGGEPICAGSPRSEMWTAWFARRSDDHCGAAHAWAAFSNV
jgi:hypothetical protein